MNNKESSLFSRVKSLVDELDHYCYLEYHQTHWTKIDYEVVWANNDGDIYSCESHQGCLSRDDSVIINADTGCGDTVTLVFLKHMELSEDDFYDRYGD